jgi:hypothetical protein
MPPDTPPRRDPRTLTLAARREFARFVFRVYVATGETPSPTVRDYLRPFLADEMADERAGLARLDRLTPVGGARGTNTGVARLHDPTPLRNRLVGREVPLASIRPTAAVRALQPALMDGEMEAPSRW